MFKVAVIGKNRSLFSDVAEPTFSKHRHTKHTLVYNIHISQGSVATLLRCVGVFIEFYCNLSQECAGEIILRSRSNFRNGKKQQLL